MLSRHAQIVVRPAPMSRVLITLFELLRFKAGPQDLPHSWTLLLAAVGAFVVTGVLSLSPTFSVAEAIPQVALELALMTLLLYGVLGLLNRQQRFLQALIAFLLVGATLQLLSWPVMAVVYARGEPERIALLPSMLLLGLLFWNLALIAHILRHTLEVSQLQAALMTVGYYLVLTVAALSIFPSPEAG